MGIVLWQMVLVLCNNSTTTMPNLGVLLQAFLDMGHCLSYLIWHQGRWLCVKVDHGYCVCLNLDTI